MVIILEVCFVIILWRLVCTCYIVNNLGLFVHRDAKALQEKLERKAAKDAAGAHGGKDGMKTKK